jgi:hypothetical protein
VASTGRRSAARAIRPGCRGKARPRRGHHRLRRDVGLTGRLFRAPGTVELLRAIAGRGDVAVDEVEHGGRGGGVAARAVRAKDRGGRDHRATGCPLKSNLRPVGGARCRRSRRPARWARGWQRGAAHALRSWWGIGSAAGAIRRQPAAWRVLDCSHRRPGRRRCRPAA